MSEPFESLQLIRRGPFNCLMELVFTERLPRPEGVSDKGQADRLRVWLAWLESELLPEAVRDDDIELVRGLLAAGALPNHIDDMYGNLLSIAVAHQHHDLVSLLIEAGVDMNVPGESGNPPLCIAIDNAEFDDDRMYDILMSAGADIHGATTLSRTPLATAVTFGEDGIVATLLKMGADPNARGQAESPLDIALREGHDHLAEILIEAGAIDSDDDDEERE